MKVALVVLGRIENRYAVEYVKYYKNLGFDDIFIVDNNYVYEEKFENVLQQYIDENFVHIIGGYGGGAKTGLQTSCYEDAYKNLSNDYDWIAFFDFDEYLYLVKDTNVKNYLSRKCFENYNQILINWKIYTDNNLIYDDGRTCIERFTTPMDIKRNIEYDFPENKHVKAFLRCIPELCGFKTPHNATSDILMNTTCNSVGEKTTPWPFQTIVYDLAYIKHFTTKTISEYIENKCKKGVGDRTIDSFNDTYGLDRFFLYNDVTDEKLNFLKENGFDIIKYINKIKNIKLDYRDLKYNYLSYND